MLGTLSYKELVHWQFYFGTTRATWRSLLGAQRIDRFETSRVFFQLAFQPIEHPRSQSFNNSAHTDSLA